MPPSILFDARLVLTKPTGIGQYIASLLPAMTDLARDWHFHVLHQPQPWADYGLVAPSPNVTWHVSALPHMDLRQQIYLPRLAQQVGADLLHYPHFDAPVLWRTTPTVVTIHDAKYLVHPAFFPNFGRLKRAYMWLFFAASAHRAAALIAVSQHTAADLLRLFTLAPTQITVVYEAVAERFQPASSEAIGELCQRYQLVRPFILSVGERRPHKNQVGLIRAYAQSQSRHSHDLVVIGQAYGDYTAPEEMAQQLGVADRVHFFSAVNGADLVTFYSAADLFALISFYEGFGLPILEAMACDTPVLASATTSAAEITGSGGVTVDPHDPAAVATALDAIVQSPARRQALVEQGRLWRQQFTWLRAAAETLAVYERVLRR